MQRGNLVIYDEMGKIFSQTGEAEGDVLPHEYPVGLPYLEIPFGTMGTQHLVGVDVSSNPHVPIFEEMAIPKTPEQLRIVELESQLAQALLGAE